MWPRVVEIMLGVWLAISPFVFRHRAEDIGYWAVDFGMALAIWLFSSLSFWERTRFAHVGILLVAAFLLAYGFLATGHPTPPALQNHVVIGFLLLMFGIIPNHAEEPPRAWRPGAEEERTPAR
jgi:peptidoglycan/LPS O-acetylase OafA/YrhL